MASIKMTEDQWEEFILSMNRMATALEHNLKETAKISKINTEIKEVLKKVLAAHEAYLSGGVAIKEERSGKPERSS